MPTPRTPITNVCAVGIIYRKNNPSHIFIDRKDDGHPMKFVRDQLCPIGGNWIGAEAKDDLNPLATFKRALNNELSFERPMRNLDKLVQMGMADAANLAPTPSNKVLPTAKDIAMLNELKATICRLARPFGDYLNTIPKSVMDAADPDNKRGGYITLASYYTVGLSESKWSMLNNLQRKFDNLSKDSVTEITSLDEIIKTNTKTAFAHDRVLKQFWLNLEFHQAAQLPLVPGMTSVPQGRLLSSYKEYLELYEVANMPS